MNFIGMGTMEVLIVLLVAFIFLGPNRMVDAARFLGKIAGEARRMAAELPSVVLEEDESVSAESRIVHREGGPNPATLAETSPDREPTKSKKPSVDDDGPVAFHSAGGAQPQHDVEPPQRQDQA